MKVVEQPKTRLKIGETTRFTISFSPKTTMEYIGKVSIGNNDKDFSPYTFTIKGLGYASVIHVRQEDDYIPSVNGSYDFGDVKIGESSPEITFTIENVGTEDLILEDIPMLKISGADSSMFTINQDSTDSTIAPQETTTFTITFNPMSVGSKSAEISIDNNDPKYGHFVFSVLGNGSTAEINVKQGTKDVPSETGSYDFGNALVGIPNSVEFTIENLGNVGLNLTGSPFIEITGTDAAMFTVNQAGVSSTITPGGSTQFEIEFTPTDTGSKTALVSIANDDTDENPYTFTITGSAISPEINVKQGTTDILSGSGSYDFGNVLTGSSSSNIEFTIENIGNASLNLTGSPFIEVTGTDAAMFNVNQLGLMSGISPGGSTKFTITFTPTSIGAKTATISIANDDVDENPYTFTITGTGLGPEINVKQGTTDILSGSGSFSFGYVLQGKSSPDVTFTIENLGTSDLNLTNPPTSITISGTDAAMFTVNQSMTTSSINPGNSTTFTVTFTPTSRGRKTATISIANDDSDENPYTFTVIGLALVYTEGDVNSDGIPDVLVGAFNLHNGMIQTGYAYIFLGKSSWNQNYTASNADIKIVNEGGRDGFGHQVSFAGDVNADGYEDIIIGAWENNSGGTRSGAAYIFYGSNNMPSTINASNADVKLIGENEGDYFGVHVSSAGDVNNDGYADVIVGAHFNDNNGYNAGCAYIFFGGSNMPSTIDAANADVKLVGESLDDEFGVSVSNAGDVNADGVDDVIVGAYFDDDGGNTSGCAFIFYGPFTTSQVIYASNADVKLVGMVSNGCFGRYLSYAGDVNADGYDDVIVGSPFNGYVGQSIGCAYIFFGNRNLPSIINSSNADVILVGESSADMFSINLCSAGDINNDGFDDVIVGAPDDDDGGMSSGCAFVFFGSSKPPSIISSSNANLKIVGADADDRFGTSVSKTGDINGDGINDIIIGAYRDDDGGNESGCAFIFFGRSSFQTLIDASAADTIIAGDTANNCFGMSVTSCK